MAGLSSLQKSETCQVSSTTDEGQEMPSKKFCALPSRFYGFSSIKANQDFLNIRKSLDIKLKINEPKCNKTVVATAMSYLNGSTSNQKNTPSSTIKPNQTSVIKSVYNNNNINNFGNTKKSLPTSRKRKVYEPECLVISSDEEENGNSNGTTEEATNDQEEEEDTSKEEDLINLNCRSVRIGSLRFNTATPSETIDVALSQKGFSFTLPSSKGMSNITIYKSEINSLLGHFGRMIPCLFVAITDDCVKRLLETLKTSPEKDLVSSTQKDISNKVTFVLNKVDSVCKLNMCKIFTLHKTLKEISQSEANELLVKTVTDNTTTINSSMSTRPKSTRLATAKALSQPITLLVYPPPPHKSGITITSETLSCLDKEAFLNDTIIEFYLTYLSHEKITDEIKEKTHIFSSFFYATLTKSSPKITGPNNEYLSIEVRRHQQVKNWTRNVNLFQKEFIIIPINQYNHWFLIIVSLNKEAFLIDNNSTGERLGSIYLFNSLDENRNSYRVILNIRNYFQVEWDQKNQGRVKQFNTITFPAYFPKVPQQNNFSDCGIYTLLYAEYFLRNPFKDKKESEIDLKTWFLSEEAEEKRVFIRKLVYELKEKNEKPPSS